MGYLIFTHEQITPERIVRPRLEGGSTMIENPAQAQLPVGADVCYIPPQYNRFSADPADRTMLLTSPTGQNTSMEIFTAFPAIRDPKEAEIRLAGGKALSNLATPYGPEERESWATQQREARAWLQDNTTPTPMLTAMATVRQITLDVMVVKVMENVLLFESAVGQILGLQQHLLDQIYTATDYDTMLAIKWPA